MSEFKPKTIKEVMNQEESDIVVDSKGNIKMKDGSDLNTYLLQWLDHVRPDRGDEDTDVCVIQLIGMKQLYGEAYMYRNMGA